MISKVKVKNLRKELDVLHEKLTLYRILDQDRGKLAHNDSKVQEIADDEQDVNTTSNTELDKSVTTPVRVAKLWATFQDDENLYLITENLLERGGKELWDFCRTFGLENHRVVEYTFYQICKAVQQSHYYQVIHRDLKPENMFYVENRSLIKLIDFGSSIMVDQPELRKVEIDDHPKRNKFTNFVGTPHYMAPECAHNKETTYVSDVWSLGCILYQLYWGITWFRGGSEYLIFLKSTEANYQYPDSEDIIPQVARDLIDKMIKVETEERISLDDLINDTYFDNVREMIQLPPITKEETSLMEIKEDIIKRWKVHKMDTQEVFTDTITQEIKEKLGQEYFDNHKEFMDHFIKLGINYVYDIEWQFE